MLADPSDADPPPEHIEEGGLMVNAESRHAAAPAIVLAATLGLAAACWAATVALMDGMDMGVATRPGSFGFFAAMWVTMMAAMMLPGAAPAFARHVRLSGKAT